MLNKDAYRFSVRDDTSFRVEDSEGSGEVTPTTITITVPEGYEFELSGDLTSEDNDIIVAGDGTITIKEQSGASV